MSEKNALDLLLNMEVPKPEIKQYKHKRLSSLCGEDVILTLREIGFSRVAEIKGKNEDDMDVAIVLAAVAEPDLKNRELMEKYGAVTPAELVKKMFRPGEIADIARMGERLSGYRMETLEDLGKKSGNTRSTG